MKRRKKLTRSQKENNPEAYDNSSYAKKQKSLRENGEHSKNSPFRREDGTEQQQNTD